MSVPAGIEDVTALGDAELNVLLKDLEREERLVSKRRTTLHSRIDFVRAGGFASTDPEYEQLSTLQAAEAELSTPAMRSTGRSTCSSPSEAAGTCARKREHVETSSTQRCSRRTHATPIHTVGGA